MKNQDVIGFLIIWLYVYVHHAFIVQTNNAVACNLWFLYIYNLYGSDRFDCITSLGSVFLWCFLTPFICLSTFLLTFPTYLSVATNLLIYLHTYLSLYCLPSHLHVSHPFCKDFLPKVTIIYTIYEQGPSAVIVVFFIFGHWKLAKFLCTVSHGRCAH